MRRILDNPKVVYLITVITVSVFIALTLFIWYDNKSLKQPNFRQEKTATNKATSPTLEDGRQKTGSGKRESQKPVTQSTAQSEAMTKPAYRKAGRKRKLANRQVDTQKRLSKRRHEKLLERAEDLEVNDENIMLTGE